MALLNYAENGCLAFMFLVIPENLFITPGELILQFFQFRHQVTFNWIRWLYSDIIFEGLIDQQSVTEHSTRIVQNNIKVKGQGHLKLDQLSPLYRFSSENKEQKSKCRKLR